MALIKPKHLYNQAPPLSFNGKTTARTNTHEANTTMLLSLSCKQRIHAMNISKRFGVGESRGILVKKMRRPISLKQMLGKMKYQLKQALSCRKGRGKRFGYDSESYSQNFDDGFISDLY